MNNFNEKTVEEKTLSFNSLVDKYSDSTSKIAVLKEKEKELRLIVDSIGEIKTYDFNNDIDNDILNAMIVEEENNIEVYGKDIIDNNNLDAGYKTELRLAKTELEKYLDFNFEYSFLDYNGSLSEIKEGLVKDKVVLDNDLKICGDDITTTKTNIKNIEESDSKEKYKVFDKAISEAQIGIDLVNKEVIQLHEDFKVAELLKELYNAGWLKNELIGQVVGGINGIIGEITTKYDMPVSCEFDSGFNSKLFKYGIETKYGMCSLGQRKMLSLISIISIVFYYKQVYPKINFIFLDEALSSLTEVNANKMISVISEYLVNKLGMTVFISHHSFLKTSYFDNKYKLEEVNLMTKVSVNKDEEWMLTA